MAAHAVLSPSAAHKWMLCPAAIAAEIGYKNESSEHARQGTAAHQVAEEILSTPAANDEWFDLTAYDYIGRKICGWLITDDMADPIQTYVNTVRSITEGFPLYVERRVDFSHLVGVPKSFGTADAIAVVNDELQIHDLKFGLSRVDAYRNPQLLIYALAALRVFSLAYDLKGVRVFIHQPRLNHVSEYALTLDELEEFAKEVRKAAQKAMTCYRKARKGVQPTEKDFNPGKEQCKWCRAAPTCKAHAQKVYELVAADFEDLSAPEIVTMDARVLTPDEVLAAYEAIPFIEQWIKAINGYVYSSLINGERINGLKLVQGRAGARKWTDAQAVDAVLKDLGISESIRYAPPTLLTPTQTEKALKKIPEAWEIIQTYITRSEGSPSVAKENDPRPPININTADLFDNVEK
ncbi:DUF2800 domain-containing protein [Enterobacter huaxiensis]|uniref:DUF2800 domain-containing protein n=1 Tax=Enterobacter huaxiensis TaxID=2494702 RepID=UPI0021760320|nr:DUF2800 domain-containing protein [Enterobacter huaxiensis]MCS5452527.1 DUF2800 domain-containing protein [Enterobacter huaxiensis]